MTDLPTRISYGFLLALLVVVGWLHWATLFLAALIAYLALTKLHWAKRRSRWLAVGLFAVLLSALRFSRRDCCIRPAPINCGTGA